VFEPEPLRWDDLPPKAAAQLEPLGEPISQFPVNKNGLIVRIVLGIVFALLGSAVCLGMLWLRDPGEEGGTKRMVPLLAILLLPVGGYVAVSAYHNWGLRLLIFEGGIARLHKGRLTSFSWEEIEVVRMGSKSDSFAKYSGITSQLTLVPREGTPMILDDHVPGLWQLCQVVQKRTLPTLLARALKRYRAGKPVEFGWLEIDEKGVTAGTRYLKWKEIDEFLVERESIMIYCKDDDRPWYAGTGANKLENTHVLKALLKEIRSADD
jgi:hypothetical protein